MFGLMLTRRLGPDLAERISRCLSDAAAAMAAPSTRGRLVEGLRGFPSEFQT